MIVRGINASPIYEARGGTTALGVPVKVDKVDVGLFAGKVDLVGLNIANPPGFPSAEFATLRTGSLQVAMGSLRGDIVQAPQLVIDGVTLHLERAGDQMNYLPILEHIKSRETSHSDDGGKKFIVREVVIRNVDAHLDLVPEGGALTRAVVRIPEVRLKDVGTSTDAASMSTLVATIVKALLQATIQSSGQSLPGELLADFRRALDSLKSQAIDLGQGTSTTLEDLGDQLQRGADKAVDEITKHLPKKKD